MQKGLKRNVELSCYASGPRLSSRARPILSNVILAVSNLEWHRQLPRCIPAGPRLEPGRCKSATKTLLWTLLCRLVRALEQSEGDVVESCALIPADANDIVRPTHTACGQQVIGRRSECEVPFKTT